MKEFHKKRRKEKNKSKRRNFTMNKKGKDGKES